MNAEKLRSQHDLVAFKRLLADRHVQQVVGEIAKQESKGHLGIRRRLLSTSVRLSTSMAQQVHDIVDACGEKLGVSIPIELYVFPSPAFNAACVKPEDGRLFVMFSSSLLEAFTEQELSFVIGHELGHHLYKHHDVPIGYILRGQNRPSPRLALDLTSWSRFAEISADRAGAYCAGDLEAVAHSLFKLASGLSGRLVQFTLKDFLQQLDEMQLEDGQPGLGAPAGDWFLTHPFSPLRVKALKLFDDSVLARAGGQSVEDLEVAVQGLMSLMEPSYLEGRTDTAETMRRLLFAGTIVIAATSNGISDREIEVFEKFFGKASFSTRLDVQKIQSELPDRIIAARNLTSLPQRMQVVRDLCTLSRADGYTTDQEVNTLRGIARDLAVPETFVDQTINADTELD